jgi:hypothetical protein
MDLTNPPRPQDCRFSLQMPRQYAASKALRKAQKTVGTEPKTLQMLQKASDAEQARNNADLKVRNGNMAVFGSVFQVYSPTADKFIHAEKAIAREDDTALECSLGSSEYRSKMPWFRIMPGECTICCRPAQHLELSANLVLAAQDLPRVMKVTEFEWATRSSWKASSCHRHLFTATLMGQSRTSHAR